MQLLGHIHNGVVVLTDGPVPPEGTEVVVNVPTTTEFISASERRRVQLPLVDSDQPGALRLTNERIAEIFADDEISS